MATPPSIAPEEIEEYRQEILNDRSEDKHVQAEEWSLCRDNFLHWCQTWVWIIDKDTLERTLFRLNPVQLQYHLTRTIRDIILKARKVGVSTYKLAEGLHTFQFFPDRECLLITHNNDTSYELFDRAKLAFDLQPAFLRPSLRHRQGSIRVAECFPKNCEMDGAPSGSKYQIMSAEGHEPARGFHLANVHCSEYAMFKRPKEFRASVLQACAATAPCALESTANGFNAFRDEYVAAREGGSLFRAHFFPWTDDPTCQIPVRNPDKWGPHVRLVSESAQLSPEQTQFYQDRLEMLGNDVDKLKQEWPLNDVEAFLSSGRSYFDMDLIQRLTDLAAQTPALRVEAA